MALWNEKAEGDELEECPICFVFIAKRKRTIHVKRCYEMYESTLDDRGLMRCPLHQMHIFPKKYLNHHLDGNCETAQNLLRRYFEMPSELKDKQNKPLPENFLADVPDEVLSYNNKRLLYLLKKDLDGDDIIDGKELDPEEEMSLSSESSNGEAASSQQE